MSELQETSKERILHNSAKLFAQKGYASVGMREIATHAEVNLAMINYFFGSKKGLLKEILETGFSGFLELMEEELSRDQPLEGKARSFIHRAIGYIQDNRDYMIVFLAELPHDDPEIIEFKASLSKNAMYLVQTHICSDLKRQFDITLSPAAIGPPLICMMFSRFLFEPMLQEIQPPGYGEQFLTSYPDFIAEIFINGLLALAKKLQDEKNEKEK